MISPLCVWFFGSGHGIRAEVYMDIDLQQGETQQWSRSYEFFSSQTRS